MDHATTNVPLEAAHAAKKALVTHEWITPRNATQAHAGPHGHTDHTTDGTSGPKLLFPNLISVGGDGRPERGDGHGAAGHPDSLTPETR